MSGLQISRAKPSNLREGGGERKVGRDGWGREADARAKPGNQLVHYKPQTHSFVRQACYP